ncbi:MAG TPA: carbon-nitrogen hydrolase family protein [Bryobacteraceae bacterium]|nr:carbon-nitrogen hydrolase family protein [Bryobacteraceae bacterium]
MNRRSLLQVAAGAGAARVMAGAQRVIPVALIQFDSVPEQVDRNLGEMERLCTEAARRGARWIMFHEGTVCDYTPRLDELAEPVPAGKCTRLMVDLARRLRCHISFGLSEAERGRYFITQVFVGPRGFVYRYRKTWIWFDRSDKGYRDEWARYDPGTGPEMFEIDGVKATCFVCADGEARRCVERAAALHPQIVFYPNNRGGLPALEVFGERAKKIGAPMLVANRVGNSWMHPCKGGCVAYGADGTVLAKANREGREEILTCDVTV